VAIPPILASSRAEVRAKGSATPADAIILDLEDSVPSDRKEKARQQLTDAVRDVAKGGADVLVRINAEPEEEARDLQAAVIAGVVALVVPKASSTRLAAIARAIDAFEASGNAGAAALRLVAQIEDVHALAELDAIAQSTPRLVAMTLGSEDFSASAGMTPIPETLFMPNQMLVFACKRAGIEPLGFPSSIAAYRATESFAASVQLARQMGFMGACCIHPSQIDVLNRAFTPTEDEVSCAHDLLAAFHASQVEGHGALRHNGAMVDRPVVLRAEALLQRAARIQARITSRN